MAETRETRYKWAVATVLDEWRRQEGLTHTQFCAQIGRTKYEWANLRAGRINVSETFMLAARAKLSEYSGMWRRKLDAAYQEDALARVIDRVAA